MKLFSTGDFHGDTRLAEKLARQASEEKADLVLICGDLTHADNDPSRLVGPFTEKDLRVCFVPGNHDSFATADWWERMYGATNLHGEGRVYDDVGVFGVGGANIGLAALTEDEIYAHLSRAHERVRDVEKKVMVTHVHPTGSKMERLTQFFPGSSGIRKALDAFRPDVLLCCHVHEAAGLEEKIGETKVFNVCRQATTIEL